MILGASIVFLIISILAIILAAAAIGKANDRNTPVINVSNLCSLFPPVPITLAFWPFSGHSCPFTSLLQLLYTLSQKKRNYNLPIFHGALGFLTLTQGQLNFVKYT